jgi:hypothetical protein
VFLLSFLLLVWYQRERSLSLPLPWKLCVITDLKLLKVSPPLLLLLLLHREKHLHAFWSIRLLSVFPLVSRENLFSDISRSHSFSS